VQTSCHFLISLVCHVSGWRATRVSHFKVCKPLALVVFVFYLTKKICANLMLHSHGLPKWWACGFPHHFSRAWSSVGRHTPLPIVSSINNQPECVDGANGSFIVCVCERERAMPSKFPFGDLCLKIWLHSSNNTFLTPIGGHNQHTFSTNTWDFSIVVSNRFGCNMHESQPTLYAKMSQIFVFSHTRKANSNWLLEAVFANYIWMYLQNASS
jgi:hypothetical protein